MNAAAAHNRSARIPLKLRFFLTAGTVPSFALAQPPQLIILCDPDLYHDTSPFLSSLINGSLIISHIMEKNKKAAF